jgi:hypothetical protein
LTSSSTSLGLTRSLGLSWSMRARTDTHSNQQPNLVLWPPEPPGHVLSPSSARHKSFGLSSAPRSSRSIACCSASDVPKTTTSGKLWHIEQGWTGNANQDIGSWKCLQTDDPIIWNIAKGRSQQPKTGLYVRGVKLTRAGKGDGTL